MRQNKLAIIINRPLSQVFEFTINPNNTPLWIDFIAQEQTDKSPSVGTIYRNLSTDGKWSEYEMTEFKPNTTFTLTQTDGNYAVRYSFKALGDNQTEMEYYEWVEAGDLEDPFSSSYLEKLKQVMEN